MEDRGIGGNAEGRVEGGTYRGLYLACHMKGADALPMQYAMSMIAFTVMRFVCPDVTAESHERESTKPVVPTPSTESAPRPLYAT